MPMYILLSTLTPEGSQTLHKNPDRLEEVNKEIADFGCKVVGQYATLGSYDFVSIIEAPDNETIAHLSVDLSSRAASSSHKPIVAARVAIKMLRTRPANRAPTRDVSSVDAVARVH